jgi:HSP20 family protein
MFMSISHDLKTRTSGTAANAAGTPSSAKESSTVSKEFSMIPAVDIFEDAQQLTLQADMPGVAKENLKVEADRDSLLIEGQVGLGLPAGMSALYADLQTTKYRRTFTLSSELDSERIAANLKDGLLTVRIPKRAEFRTRKIRVDVA